MASYSILSTNAKGLHREVLRRILEGEVDAWKNRDAEITPANYEAKPMGMRVVNGKNCEALELISERKKPFCPRRMAVRRPPRTGHHCISRARPQRAFPSG